MAGPAAALSRIDETGAWQTFSPVGQTITPWSLAFDAAGNVYVGDWEIGGYLSKFSSDGAFLGVAISRESGHIDLAPNQCTMFLQAPGHTDDITEPRWNACTGTAVDSFHQPDLNQGEKAERRPDPPGRIRADQERRPRSGRRVRPARAHLLLP